MTLYHSESESLRFGMRVFRSEGVAFQPEECQQKLIELEADLLILRLHSDPGKSTIENIAVEAIGFNYIHADDLVTYVKDLDDNPPRTHSNQITYEKVRHDHFLQLNSLIADVFKGYNNHYIQNPFLDENAIISGYQEWAWRMVTPDLEAPSYIAFFEGQPAGFAICSADFDSGTCTIQLNGVHPHFQRKAIYTDLLRLIMHESYKIGLRQIRVSTQTGNTSVQKIWTGEGFNFSAQYSTYHVLPLLQYSSKEKMSIPITFRKYKKEQDHSEWLYPDEVIEEMATSGSPFAKEYLKNIIWEKCIVLSPVSSLHSYILSVSIIPARRGDHHMMVQILQDNTGKKYLLKYVGFQLSLVQ